MKGGAQCEMGMVAKVDALNVKRPSCLDGTVVYLWASDDKLQVT